VTNGHHAAILRHVHALFEVGTLGDRTDRQLLDEFRGGGESAGPAFTVLVERHGPMVLHVCRASLRDSHDIEDAFQATFLVLVRRAHSLWVRDSLGPWLYSVACRVTVQARVSAARRQLHERRAASRASVVMPDSTRGALADEITPRVHEELSLLPERYRAPLILCHLQGLTHEQAAQQLGCPLGTVRSRLARGREQLRSRLVRRGLAPSMSSIGIGFMKPAVHAPVPPAWVENTVGAAISLDAGGSVSIVVSTSVLRLVKGVLATMFLTKLKALGASFLIVMTIGFGAGVMARQDFSKDEPRNDGETIRSSVSGETPKYPVSATKLALDSLAAGSSSWGAHRIVAVPGAKIHLRIETNDKKVTQCEAVVRDDGRLRIVEEFVDHEREGRTRSEFTSGSIVISSEESRERWTTKAKPQAARWYRDETKDGSTRTVEVSNHESRLREVEQKLERVLELLESKTTGKTRSRPDMTPK
jgi:RNA polymerase sigma factor (sigma-70 family)